jgi:SsrA-binding protein
MPEIKVIAVSRKAYHKYHIIEKLEAGIILTGMEIKAIRSGGISLDESYVRPFSDGIYLLGAHIKQYTHSGGVQDYDPVRPRKLLLHKREINLLKGRVEQRGMTIIPLQLYLKGGRAKLEIALAKGKDVSDKRAQIKEREVKLEISRRLKSSL